MNSYSAVDRPDISGEPWVGASFTMDGGLTWKSHLHPGFQPKDPPAPAPLAPPLGYETAADPVVRLAPGIGLFSFIAFNRDGAGALLLGRWYERTIESGFPYAWKDTVEIAKGTGSPTPAPGRFVDKPAMTVSLLPGTGTYDFTVPDPTPAAPAQTRIQKVPAGIVHVSTRCSPATAQQDGTKISLHKVDQLRRQLGPGDDAQREPEHQPGAGHRRRSKRTAAWSWSGGASRTRRRSSPTPSCPRSRSTTAGRSDKPTVRRQHLFLHAGDDVGELPHHDAPVHHIRRHGLPRHLGRSARGRAGQPRTGYSRIVMSNLSFTGSTPRWSNPAPVDTVSPASRRGHEFLPAIAAAGNRILVTWLDSQKRRALSAPRFPIRFRTRT